MLNSISPPQFYINAASVLYSFFLTVALLKLIEPILKKYGLIDAPGGRRAHKKPTLRGAGLALVLSFLLSLAQIHISWSNLGNSINYLSYISIILLAGISFLDDIKPVHFMIRLFVHFLVATLAVNNFLGVNLLFHGKLNQAIDLFAAIFILTAYINIYNFLDGIDGLSSLQSIHLSISTIILCTLNYNSVSNNEYVLVSSVLLLGCSLAFIIFNWPPAKMFIGDIGSTFLGLIHGLNLIILSSSSQKLMIASLIITLYYLADGGLTIIIRILKQEKFWLPHLDHFFQQAVKKGMSHKEIDLKICLCNIFLLLFALYSFYNPILSVFLSISIVMLLLLHFRISTHAVNNKNL